MDNTLKLPDYLFESSWEICNKTGGIHTCISSKASLLKSNLDQRYILIGPDVWREDEEHPEFDEDDNVYPEWRDYARNNGLRVRTGRWKVPGNPVVFLVDFTPLISQKDEIFAKFWELYRLDSLSGQWDYIEPALFGYAAGKVIENFVHYNLSFKDKVIAHFHEWLTGSGILYLKQAVPQVATIFTTHSTVVGRTLGKHNMPLYRDLKTFNPELVAREYGVLAKHSMELNTVRNADVFTTVSEITANECSHFLGRTPDFITINGLDLDQVPKDDELKSHRENSRKILMNVAEKMIGYKLPSNTLLTCTGGRYEFRNKGIDVFLDSLENINRVTKDCPTSLVAFILVPTSHNGPDKELIKRLNGETKDKDKRIFSTHVLTESDYDQILGRIKLAGIDNSEMTNVKVIFVPSYLDGDDSVFNIPYYDVLSGMDLTIFPSYYEPWGYTVLESLSFSIPTATTSLSGIGNWILKNLKNSEEAIRIIERRDEGDQNVIDAIGKFIEVYCTLSELEKTNRAASAKQLATNFSWKKFIENYYLAFEQSLSKVHEREDKFYDAEQTSPVLHEVKKPKVNEPIWNTINVHSHLPEKIRHLEDIVNNYWWTWDCEARELIENIDPDVWKQVEYNPILYFESLSFTRLTELSTDTEFIQKLDGIYKRFKTYIDESNNKKGPKIAYFSMEYGIHPSLKIYSGGLGVLAGDYLKEASDLNYDLVAVGFLYRYGYFKQMVSVFGEQLAEYEYQHFSKLPVEPVKTSDGNQLTVSLKLPGRTCFVRVWRVNVGRTPLILLDTDFEANQEQDRFITHQLYGGDNENRLKQEMVLGIAGIRALQALGIEANIYHSNEGHSAFISLERLRHIIDTEKVSFAVAKEIVRSTTLFTTHTPVPAGHDSFHEDLLRTYMSHYPSRLKIQWEDFMNMGRSAEHNPGEKFNMSYLAANLSQAVNGVSMLHGDVSKDILAPLWKGFLPKELHIGYVTNGVHLPTWTAKEWMDFYKNEFGDDFLNNQLDKDRWAKIYNVADEHIWHTKNLLRKKLIEEIQSRLHDNWLIRNRNPREVVKIMDSFTADKLTIGFARRFATYKRATLLFNNPDRLAKIVNNPSRPVQFLFAGKAHPADKGGQALIKHIMELSKKDEFQGKILFLQNYDMELAKKLVQGVDVWLNTPTRPLEASGTSGEKAVMNGTLHFSVLDGWWVEGYEKDAGWALPAERTFENQEFQNELDAEKIYSIIENEIVPAFYNRNMHGIPTDWIRFVKNSIAHVAPKFTTTRMFHDYVEKYYSKLFERSQVVKEDDYHLAKVIASWKKRISMSWDNVQVISNKILEGDIDHVRIGGKFSAELVLNLADLRPEEVGAEFIITQNLTDIVFKSEYEFIKFENGKAFYKVEFSPSHSGTYNFGVRIYPKHKDLPHRQDFMLMRWI